MSRRTALTAAVTTAVLASGALLAAGPANAEAIVFEPENVHAVPPPDAEPSREHATIEIPTGYTRHKVNWHQWAWVENIENGVTIQLDLKPNSDTVRELRAERNRLRSVGGDDYREFDFTVNEPGRKVRARWVFTYSEPFTDDVDSFVGVVLLRDGNRVLVAGRLDERRLATRIRRHVVDTIRFPG